MRTLFILIEELLSFGTAQSGWVFPVNTSRDPRNKSRNCFEHGPEVLFMKSEGKGRNTEFRQSRP
jgi:hypothetical protein